MIARLRWVLNVCLVGVFAMVLVSCDDSPPPPSHYVDLGDQGRVLTPVGSPWYAVTGEGKRATAEWVAFRDPTVEVVEEEIEVAGEGAEADIRELINDYNELAAENDFEEMLLYYVDEQQEPIGVFFELIPSAIEKLEALRTAFTEKLPDDSERIDAAVDILLTGFQTELEIDSLTVVSETEVSGELSARPVELGYRFKLIEDEWFIEIVDLPDINAVKPQLEMLLTTFDTMIQGIQSGQAPAAMLDQFDQMAKMVNQMQGGGAPPAEGEDAAKPTEESGDAAETEAEAEEPAEDVEGG